MYLVLLLACSAVLNGAWLWEGYPFNARHNLTSPPSSGDQGHPGDKPHQTSSADDNGPAPTDSPGNRPTQGPPSPEQRSRAEVLDSLQTALDVAGMLPGIGLAFDVVNAGIHAARGNWGEADRVRAQP